MSVSLRALKRIKPQYPEGFMTNASNTGYGLSSLRTGFWRPFKSIMNTNPEWITPDDCTKTLARLSAHFDPLCAARLAKITVLFMRRQNFKLDLRDYHSLLMISTISNNHVEVVEYFDNMFALDYIKPDVISYNFLMKSHLLNNNLEGLISTFEQCGIFY